MVVIHLTIFDQAVQPGQEPLARDAASLYRAFEQVKDGRGKKGRRYPLVFFFYLDSLRKDGRDERSQLNCCLDI
jgi:hypothetical protein